MVADVRNSEGWLSVYPVHSALICGLRPGITMCTWGLDREDECSSQTGHMPTSPQSQPLTAVRRGGTGWSVGSGRDGGGSSLWVCSWCVGMTSKLLLTRPVQVTFMAWGRHSGWHCTHSEFSTNSLGSLRGGRQETGQRHPYKACFQMLSGFTCLNVQVTPITSLRKTKQFYVKVKCLGN